MPAQEVRLTGYALGTLVALRSETIYNLLGQVYQQRTNIRQITLPDGTIQIDDPQDPRIQSTTFEYDALGNQTKTILTDGSGRCRCLPHLTSPVSSKQPDVLVVAQYLPAAILIAPMAQWHQTQNRQDYPLKRSPDHAVANANRETTRQRDKWCRHWSFALVVGKWWDIGRTAAVRPPEGTA